VTACAISIEERSSFLGSLLFLVFLDDLCPELGEDLGISGGADQVFCFGLGSAVWPVGNAQELVPRTSRRDG